MAGSAGFAARVKSVAAGGLVAILVSGSAGGAPVVSCNGSALVIGTFLLCSHNDPRQPPQLCSFSWALVTSANQTQVVDGSFWILPGISNFQVYSGAGFTRAMSNPIVICKGKQGALLQ